MTEDEAEEARGTGSERRLTKAGDSEEKNS